MFNYIWPIQRIPYLDPFLSPFFESIPEAFGAKYGEVPGDGRVSQIYHVAADQDW